MKKKITDKDNFKDYDKRIKPDQNIKMTPRKQKNVYKFKAKINKSIDKI